jgi:nucleoside-diphosphate-sugar epimerase
MSDDMNDKLRGRRVLVTGGAGFIGSNLLDALVAAGAEPVVLDDFSTGRRENLVPSSGRFELVEGSICDPEACRLAARECELVFHQAALGSVPRSMERPGHSILVNVAGTVNVFTAARDAGVRRVVYASSSSIYGDHPALPKREGVVGRALSPYALSKVMNEQAAELFGRVFGLELVGLRYFNVFGPRQNPDGPYAAAIPKFFASSLAGEAPLIHGDGEQSRDFTWVGDVVRANLLAALTPGAVGRVVNIAGGERITINRVASEIRRLAGGPEAIHDEARSGDVRDSAADLSIARELLGYEPTVPFAEGIEKAFEWYRGREKSTGEVA